MRTAKNENNLTDELKQKARQEIKARTELKASGFAGMSRKGRLVDRRKYPDAKPIAKNSFLGFAEPKTEEELKAAINEKKDK